MIHSIYIIYMIMIHSIYATLCHCTEWHTKNYNTSEVSVIIVSNRPGLSFWPGPGLPYFGVLGFRPGPGL